AAKGERVDLAAVNGPASVVLSGPAAEIEAVRERFTAAGVKTRRLKVSHAFHSSLMEPMLAEFEQIASGVAYQRPRIPVVSNVSGRVAGEELQTPAYWVRHVREAVRFADGIAWLADAGVTRFLELGPDGTLCAMGAECAEGLFVPATRRGHGEVETFTTALSRLWASGAHVDWPALFTGRNPTRVDLPTYPFQHQRYWLDRADTSDATTPDPEESRFWAAVEREDVTALVEELDTGHDALREALPALAAWRRRRREHSAVDGLRYTVTWKPLTATTQSAKGRWLVAVPEAPGDPAFPAAVQAALTAAGIEPVTLPVPLTASSGAALAERLAEHEAGTYSGVLSLLGCDPTATTPDADGLAPAVTATLALLHALTAAGAEAPLWCATRGAVAAAPSDAAPDVGGAGLWGLGRVVGLELPDLWGGLVDLPSALDERTGRLLAAALGGGDGEDQLAVRPSGLLARRLVRAGGRVREEGEWPPRGTVLITGGTGALGAHVARSLAADGAERLLLLSRRGPEAPGADALADELRAAGAEVTVTACDAADRERLAEVLAGIPDLTAVIHTAGVVEDGVAASVTEESLRRVLRPKTAAAHHLHELTSRHNLAAFVLFSSVSGTVGTLGQAAYAAANASLDALAEWRRASGLPATSVAWGPWAGGGMAGERIVETGVRRAGLVPLDPARALAALRRTVLGGTDGIVVDVEWDRFAAAFTGNRPSPLLADLPEARRVLGQGERPGGDEGLVARLAALPVRDRERAVVDAVRGLVAGALGHASPQRVDPARPFKELGFDSLTAVDLRNRLIAHIGLRLPTTLVFDYPTTTALARHLLTLLFPETDEAASAPMAAGSEVEDDPVVIIGMSCRLPGGVDSPEALWELLAEGRDAITPCPDDRGWDIEDYYDPDPERPGSTYGREGGFMTGADGFDAGFFGISPREALAMDPQQRLLLESSWETVERAGIDPHALRGSRTGVFVGLVAFDYARAYGPGQEDLEGFLGIGNSASVASGRVAYALGLEGQALTVDTACSSSLVTLHLAAHALRSGECDLALAGGVTVLPSPSIFLEFSRQRGLSADGRCRAFSSDANGFGPAEGVGMLLLERLSDARRNGHRVLAVVRGSAVNQDGASNGLTAPNGPSQQRVIRAALTHAGLTAADVDAVEAHGTGTTLGDPIEAQALLATYGQGREAERPLWLGSVKSNLGHTQAAAGVTGVIKMVLAMREGVLPKTLYVDEPTPHVDWTTGDVRLLTEPTPWPETGRVRRAGVSSFGISGTNAHVILEAPEPTEEPSAPRPVAGEPVWRGAPVPWTLSARDADALRAQAAGLADLGETDPADVSFALLTQRAALEHRAVLLGPDLPGAARTLAAGTVEDAGSVVTGRAKPPAGVTFVFPGQGSQWLGMGRELLAASPVFAARVAECEAALTPYVEWRLTELLNGPEPDSRWADWMEHVEIIQPVLWAVMISLAAVWEALGVTASAVVGHSQGELAAAVVAGALSLDDGARVITARATIGAGLTGRGGVVSVAEGADRIAERLAARHPELSVGAVNSPASTVVAGTHEALAALIEELEADGVWYRRVAHSYASHSPHMEEIRERLLADIGTVTPRPGRAVFLSTVTGGLLDTTDLDAAYWYRNQRESVAFRSAVETSLELGHTTLVEVSAHPVLVAALEDTAAAAGTAAVVTGTLRRDEGGPDRFTAAAATLWTAGTDVDWTALHAGRAPHRVDLPTYAFQRRRYWLTAPPGTAGDPAGLGLTDTGHPLLGAVVRPADDDGLLLTGRLTAHGHPWLGQHRLLGTPLLPGSALSELAIRAGDEAGCGRLRELVLSGPLVLPDRGGVQLQVTVGAPGPEGERAVAIHSRPDSALDDEPWTCHAEGVLIPETGTEPEATGLTVWPPLGAEPVDVSGFYDRAEAAGYAYGPAFHGLRAAWRLGDEIYAEVSLPDALRTEAQRYGLHPALLDAALHASALSRQTASDAPTALLQPFAWTDVRLHAAGATELRVRLTPAGPDGTGILLADPTGRTVAEVAALVQRRVDTGQLTTGADAFLHVEWTPLAERHQVAEDEEFATWAVLGDDPLDLAATLQEGGHAVVSHTDLDGLLAVIEAGVPAPEWALLPSGAPDLLESWLADERLADIRLAVVTRGEANGPVRRSQAEHPGRIIHLDLDADPDPDVPAALRTAHATGEPTLALRDGTLLVPRARRLAVGSETYEHLDGTVLVTADGEGASAATLIHHLVTERTVRSLLVAAPDAVLDDELLRQYEVTVERATGDPTDRAWLAGLLASRPVTAVVDTAADPTTTVHLHELTSDTPLKAFAVLSDAPDPRLATLTDHRRATGLPVAVVTGAPWEPGTDTSVARALAAVLDQSLPPLIATRLDPAELRRRAAAGTLPPELRDLVPAATPRRRGAVGSTAGPDPAAGDALVRKLSGLSADERLRHLIDLVRRQAAAVLGHESVDAIDAERPFKELGFDSMMSDRLRKRLAAETALPLPATLAFTYPTPTVLAAHLDERLRLTDGDAADTDDTDRVLAEIERLDTALAVVEPGVTDHAARARVVKRLQSVLWRWSSDAGTSTDGVLDGGALDSATDDEMFDLIDRELGA
ncbi:SDR family NAD(P)-dependent oxidoreductase, partial [Streptomyces sp. NPDC003635]